ncbi:hypothetical protein LJK88_04565 [Paenibacillus sp. P26]|nr:hypothetical protein LJK88_04565 [Paenibacillus sp. P26]
MARGFALGSRYGYNGVQRGFPAAPSRAGGVHGCPREPGGGAATGVDTAGSTAGTGGTEAAGTAGGAAGDTVANSSTGAAKTAGPPGGCGRRNKRDGQRWSRRRDAERGGGQPGKRDAGKRLQRYERQGGWRDRRFDGQ